jgi:hypothetical protein
MCGHHVAMRQKAHIVAESGNSATNLLLLCPSCHVIFDTQLKPKLFKALELAEVQHMPRSWKLSIYEQAAAESQRALRRKKP